MEDRKLQRLKEVLSVPTYSGDEELMITYLQNVLTEKGFEHYTDKIGNIYVTKGKAEWYPCFVSHTDTVHKVNPNFKVVQLEENGRVILTGIDKETMKPSGIGGDDKCGVFACLELLDKFDTIKVAFFVSEEVGCIGSKNADDNFFSNVGYVIEFDAPGDYMVTEYCFGVKLYDKESEFFKKTDKVLVEHMLSEPQYMVHPYTDVFALKKKYDFACINFSIGYHNYHTKNEYVCVEEVEAGIKAGEELIKSLGNVKHHFDHPSKVNI